MTTQYKLKSDQLGLPAGTILVAYSGSDYGLARDHERLTGKPHRSLSVTGGVPFYTLSMDELECFKTSQGLA